MHRKSILILIFVVLLTFGNSLLNDFVGDDYAIVVDNSFYETWANFPKLFTRAAITDSSRVLSITHDVHTGTVAYRPVLAASFFFDNALWHKNPFGYHLDNLLLHVADVILVYFILFFILSSAPVSLLGAILFAVHPLKTEAVCAIGYRGDSLACFFLLLSFLSYIRWPEFGGWKRRGLNLFSHAMFFLAVFAKESAIVYVGLLFAFDWLVRGEKIKDVFRHFKDRYAGFTLITLLYICVYVMVFPNSTLGGVRPLGGTLQTDLATILRMFSLYLFNFVWPLSVKALPPLYAPAVVHPGGYKTWIAVFCLAAFIGLVIRMRRRNGVMAFFLLWFLISYIPVSDIIPLVNPMAYRFMYLPSVGLCAVFAMWIDQAGLFLDRFSRNIQLGKLLRISVVLLYMMTTMALNTMWKNNFVMASHMVRDFPECPIGYLHLGMEYYKKGFVREAEKALQKGFAHGLNEPRGYYFMGLCFLNDFARSKPYYEKSISAFPTYALSYIGLGRIYTLQGDYAQAVPYLEKAVALAPLYTAYGYLIQSYLHLGRTADAGRVYEDAQKRITRKTRLRSLGKLIRQGKDIKGPFDIGI